jgi:putative serine protease PepD
LLAVVALAAGMVGGAIVALIWWAVDDSGPGSSATAASGSCVVDQVADQALPSVVTLHVQSAQGFGNGSGVLVNLPDGDGEGTSTYIVTNEHVVEKGPDSTVRVVFVDGRSTPGNVLGVDALTDLAVVKPDDLSSIAKPINVGDSGELRVGQPVVAIGAPLGLSSTVTSGIVSATDRYVRVPGQGASVAHLVGAIQTDAAINPGNSGGALVDCDAALVGINSAGAAPEGEIGSAGLGFAIPMSLVETLAPQLVANGQAAHPTLGMQVQPVPPAAVSDGATPGLYVLAVAPGGPAAEAGIHVGDIVVAIDKAPMRSPDDLVQTELESQVGDQVEVEFERGGETSTVTASIQRSK